MSNDDVAHLAVARAGRPDGGIVTYPLTTASAGTSTYNAMLARGLSYEASSETLYLVTRGSGSRGDIYAISNLP